MKKILLLLVLVVGIIFIGSVKSGAKMSSNEISQVRAEHILVLTQNEAQQLKTKIDNKEITFEDAARKFSQCPSGKQGGDLGYFGRGMMVKPFEVAAFEGEVGQVSEPVQTQFGWHLIKVLDKK